MIAVSAAPIDDAVFRFAQQSSSDFLVGGNINSIETEADSRILQRQGHDVHQAASADQALHLASSRILLAFCGMPPGLFLALDFQVHCLTGRHDWQSRRLLMTEEFMGFMLPQDESKHLRDVIYFKDVVDCEEVIQGAFILPLSFCR